MDTIMNRLYEAAHAGDVYSLNTLLEEDNLLLDRVVTTIAVRDNPLHIAAILGHSAFAREILQRKPNIAREFNGQGMSPLHLAAAQGHFEVVEELLQADADLCNLRENKDGYLPVHIAVIKGRHDLVPLLIEKCENFLNELTYKSETLLHLAVKANSADTVNFLTARGVTQLILNEKDSNGNTCLHLAFAGRQQQVIKHLLSQENIDVNPINTAGLTPLDVLLVTNHEIGDLYLGEMIRAHGGKTSKELGTSETILTDSTSIDHAHGQVTSPKKVFSTPSSRVMRTATLAKVEESNGNTENNLIVVATLVATVTFAAALNPPGGSIQMPFDGNDRNNSTWFSNWQHMNSTYPAGSPVYLWELKKFFKYDFYALFASITVILFCLLGVARRNKIMMKLLVLILWSSIFSMVLAFTSALSILLNIDRELEKFRWFEWIFLPWFYGFTFGAAWLFSDFLTSLLKKAKWLRPSWMHNPCGQKVKEFIRWGKIKKILQFIFMFAIGWSIALAILYALYEMNS